MQGQKCLFSLDLTPLHTIDEQGQYRCFRFKKQGQSCEVKKRGANEQLEYKTGASMQLPLYYNISELDPMNLNPVVVPFLSLDCCINFAYWNYSSQYFIVTFPMCCQINIAFSVAVNYNVLHFYLFCPVKINALFRCLSIHLQQSENVAFSVHKTQPFQTDLLYHCTSLLQCFAVVILQHPVLKTKPDTHYM